jgi:hypothetical protein
MSAPRDGQAAITKGEREDLQRLIRQRERVLKSAAKQRSAELIADLENQMGSEYSFDQDEIWAKVTEAVDREVKRAQATVAARCRELGIPDRFAPSLGMHWRGRGYDNSIDQRKAELRRMAQTKIAAIEQKAVVEIELSCLHATTEIAIAGLTSEAARAFVDRLPDVAALMPRLSFAEVAGEADPPIAEQLVTPNALRQRRYRERQTALRDAQALRALSSNADAPANPDGGGGP